MGTLPAALRAATQLFLKILHAFLAHAQEAATGTIEIEDDERDGGHDDREERRHDEVAAPEEPAADPTSAIAAIVARKSTARTVGGT